MARQNKLPIAAVLLQLVAVMACCTFLTGIASAAATINIINNDSAGEGFNDPAAWTPTGGNNATTLGQARLNAFQYAADLWGSRLQSSVTINVDAQMDPLTCTPTGAVLGSAGTITVHRNFPGAPLSLTYYPQAMANALAGVDLAGGSSDINATFNSNINGDAGCLGGAAWYYGFDANPPPGDMDFVSVVMHELGHGLGFQTYANLSTGEKFLGFDDMFMVLLEQVGVVPSNFASMTDPGRVAASISDPNLRWTGDNVTHMAGILGVSQGLNGGYVRMNAPNPLQIGSSVAHWTPTVFPNEIMEPSYTGPNHNPGLAIYLMMDMGWPMDASVGIDFREIAAQPREDSVVITWRYTADEPLAGFNVYRRDEESGRTSVANSDGPLPATARSFTDEGVAPGRAYRYHVAAVRPDGSEFRSPVVVVTLARMTVDLAQNHPNPFNAATEVRYTLGQETHVSLRVYNLSGKLVRTLVDEPRMAGPHVVMWNGQDDSGRIVASGSYFYKLETEIETRIRRMVLLK